ALLWGGCSSVQGGPPPGADGGPSDNTIVIVGVQSEELGVPLDKVQITTKVAGVPQTDEKLVAGATPVALPHEGKLAAPGGDRGARVDVEVAATLATGATLHRTAQTSFVAGQTKLLRVRLEARCVEAAPGGTGGPTCSGDQTCLSGVCGSPSVAPEQLEAYE